MPTEGDITTAIPPSPTFIMDVTDNSADYIGPVDAKAISIPGAVKDAPVLVQVKELPEADISSQETSPTEEKPIVLPAEVKDTSAHIQQNEFSSALTPSKETVSQVAKCPFLQSQVEAEFEVIKKKCPALYPTGCTTDFCQAGRMLHTDEPRVGENRDIDSVLKDAEQFLRLALADGLFKNAEECEARIQVVQAEIRANSRSSVLRATREVGLAGGNYYQTPQELEFGLRRSWLNSRKCIMRSQAETLLLKDLRHVTSSVEMAHEVFDGMRVAYNNGAIKPTAFIFPPRTIDHRGPMIYSTQVFAFAGYELEDGKVLGDPGNVQLTKDIIGLGWIPPANKTRFDLLPFVTMAEGDAPAVVELPENLQTLVKIRHPRYMDAFEAMDLRWVQAPALARQGFDIGGVQYTATPFIGWFMDAEIGVRNLADSFRYNVLPEVIKAMGLETGAGAKVEILDDLPEFEKLALLSRAQAELNYAVTWSYQQAGIAIIDSLSASSIFIEFDEEYNEKHGHRLPSDPYWIAPPQGSIIPIWHRGGAPNYQPKPLIAKHVQDPVKAWQREVRAYKEAGKELPKIVVKANPKAVHHESEDRSSRGLFVPGTAPAAHESSRAPRAHSRAPGGRSRASSPDNAHHAPHARAHSRAPSRHPAPPRERSRSTSPSGGARAASPRPESPVDDFEPQDLMSLLESDEKYSISIHYCTSGTTARKLADRLHKKLEAMLPVKSKAVLKPKVSTLDHVEVDDLLPTDILLLVVSSTGLGDIPANGQAFYTACKAREELDQQLPFKYAVFGNGDSRYTESYNEAAVKLWDTLDAIGGSPIGGSGLFEADTAVEAVPNTALDQWLELLHAVDAPSMESFGNVTVVSSGDNNAKVGPKLQRRATAGPLAMVIERLKMFATEYVPATVVDVKTLSNVEGEGSRLVTLDLGAAHCIDLGCIQLLPMNHPEKVEATLDALGLDGNAWVDLGESDGFIAVLNKQWLAELVDLELPFTSLHWLSQLSPDAASLADTLTPLSAFEVLKRLKWRDLLSGISGDTRTSIIMSFRMLNTRTYSIASAAPVLHVDGKRRHIENHIDLMIKSVPGGRFSDKFLSECAVPAPIQVRLIEAACTQELQEWDGQVPIVKIATGAGFAPVRAFLQRQIASPTRHKHVHRTSVFVGAKGCDVPLISEIVDEAHAHGVVEHATVLPSNPEKVRIHHKFFDPETSEHLKKKILDEGALVFICSGQLQANEILAALDDVLGGNARKILKTRLIQEIY